MKLCGVPILVLLLSLGAASGQQTQPRATQSTANTQAPSSRSSYDPIARGKGTVQSKGIVKQLLLGSIHRIRTMELSSRIGAKRCSKRL